MSSEQAIGRAEPHDDRMRMNYDVIRGVLILIVMLDHNDIVRNVRSVNQWFLPMTFHVAGFLLLPFLVRPKRFSLAMAGDHAVRYLTPFFFALMLYAVAFRVLITSDVSVEDWLTRVATAFVLADPSSLHDATGFIVLWFLPALLSLVLLAAFYNTVSRPWRLVVFVVCLVVHLTVGGLSQTAKSIVPQGWLIALYVFPLGVACRAIIPWLTNTRHGALLACASCAVLLTCWWSEKGSEVEVATLVLPTLFQPLRLIATDVSDVAFLTALVACSPSLGRVPALSFLGRYSLVIYLIHPLVYKPIFGVLLRFCNQATLQQPGGALIYWAGAAASVVAVGGVSLATAVSLQAWAVARKLVTPRDRDEWIVSALIGRARPQDA